MVRPSFVFAALLFGLSCSGTAASAQDLENFVLGSWEKDEPGWFDPACEDEADPGGARYGVPVRGLLTFLTRDGSLEMILVSGVTLSVAPDMDPISIHPISFRPGPNGTNIVMDGHPEFPNGVTIYANGADAAVNPGTFRLSGFNDHGDMENDLYVRCN